MKKLLVAIFLLITIGAKSQVNLLLPLLYSEKDSNSNISNRINQADLHFIHQEYKQAFESYSDLISDSNLTDTLSFIATLGKLRAKLNLDYRQSNKELQKLNLEEYNCSGEKRIWIECFLGYYWYNKSQFDESYLHYIEAEKQCDTTTHSYYLSIIQNNLGVLNTWNKEVEKSQKYLQLAAQNNSKNNYHNEVSIYNNIGVNFLLSNNNFEASRYFNLAKKISNDNKLTYELALTNFNKSFVLPNKKALKVLDSAYQIAFDIRSSFLLSKILNQKGLIYEEIGYHEKAIENAEKALFMADFSLQLKDIIQSYLILSRAYARTDEYRRAYESLDAYKIFNDSLQNIERRAKLQELQLKYNTEKNLQEIERKENQLLFLEKEKEFETLKFTSLIIIAVITIITLSSIYMFLLSRNKRKYQEIISENLIKHIDDERDRIARDLHDDLGQSLTIFKGKWLLKKEKGRDFDVEQSVDNLIEKSRKLAKQMSPTLIDKIGLEKGINVFVSDIEQSLDYFINTDFEGMDILENNLNLEQKTHLYRIIQECVNNTIKHGKTDSIKILIHSGEKRWNLEYQDNGVGIKNTSSVEGFGFRSMKQRAKLLNGEMWIDDSVEKGIKMTFNFKYLK